ncbi:MAG: ATP-binding cassette domain-containing protein, partial [Gammaproteobacteria bacterium]|nr:ATP-binding cassette domain-containing protein [Gammaproteobacteria bacterium]
KATTMKMITGFLLPDSGRVSICGDDILDKPVAAKKRLGYLPEGAPLYSDMTPRTFLDFIADIRGFSGDEKRQRIEAVIDEVNLQSVLDQSMDTLSKGFKRRVGLAQAILHDPEVLVLDEPTDGLDPNQKQEVRKLIHAMAPEKAIILSTHILEEVDAVCSRAVIIASGKLVADGTPAELEAQSPLHNAIIVSLPAASHAAAERSLSTLSDIANVETISNGVGGAMTQLKLTPKNGKNTLTEVNQCVRDNNIEVAEIRLNRGRLDDVFRSITQDVQSIS